MSSKPIPISLWLIIVIPFVYLGYRYSSLPDIVPIHYGPDGAADAWAAKQWLWVIPAALPLLSAWLLTKFIPWVDTSDNVEKMGKKYEQLTLGLTTITSAIACYIVFEAGKEQLGHLNFLVVFLGLLLVFSGNYFQTMRPNKFVGIRTPWTLANEKVWTKTHRMAGKLWFAGGLVVIMAGLLLPGSYTAGILTIALIVLIGIPTWYSWQLSKHERPDEFV